MKKEKIVVLTSNLYKPHIGGVENSLYFLSISYLKSGWTPIIVTSDIAPEGVKLPFYEEVSGVKIYRYKTKPSNKLARFIVPSFLFGIYNSFKIYRFVNKRYSPDFVVARYHFNQLMAFLGGMKNSIYLVPGVVKFQNSIKNIEKSNLKSYMQWFYHRALQLLAIKYANRVAVFSHNMVIQVNRVQLQLDFPLITKPGVCSKRFFPLEKQKKYEARNELGIKYEGRVFLCVGRCVKAKGFDLVIRALANIPDKDAQLWIVGDGPLRKEYENMARELQVSDRVVFFGAQKEPELFYRAADFFVMSSIYEPLGQTILEALASGLPIIAFDAGDEVSTATNELIGQKHGIFVDKVDVERLALAIERALNTSREEYEKLSKECRRQAINRFSWDNLANDLKRSAGFLD
ncbi:glycosyltransferase family 4 protein [Pseudoalteromonas ruthenica]|uniref:glycosyltransferase family 4 protein n=1 Tax=Pseudoalteromonas ruthenica TaxID=151081 RepID=UPI00034C0DDA|nr:glycosyltransferase family 4 protein [Pseudoalteromonas ruthenica]